MSGQEIIKGMVSIVVPVYNAGKYIGETIDMVMGQTYDRFELILVNDCSADNSVEVIKKKQEAYGEVIRLIDLKENGGAAAARNAGIDAAKGEFLAFLDADDIWLPEKLSREVAFIKEKDAAFVFCSYEFGDEEAKPTGRVVKAPSCITFRKALSRTVIFTSTVLFDLKKLTKDEVHMPIIESEDTATWWSILKRGNVAYGLDEVLVIYRRPAKSLSSNKFKAIKRIWGLYRNIAELSAIESAWYFVGWAFRATLRRI